MPQQTIVIVLLVSTHAVTAQQTTAAPRAMEVEACTCSFRMRKYAYALSDIQQALNGSPASFRNMACGHGKHRWG